MPPRYLVVPIFSLAIDFLCQYHRPYHHSLKKKAKPVCIHISHASSHWHSTDNEQNNPSHLRCSRPTTDNRRPVSGTNLYWSLIFFLYVITVRRCHSYLNHWLDLPSQISRGGRKRYLGAARVKTGDDAPHFDSYIAYLSTVSISWPR